MSKNKKAQVMFTSRHEVKDFLSKWTTRVNRTVSNLVETLVIDPLATEENLLWLHLGESREQGGGWSLIKKLDPQQNKLPGVE